MAFDIISEVQLQMANGSASTINMRGGSYEKQRAIVYDLLCAGEIEGLVGGLSGVFFNGTSIVDGTVESKKLLSVQGTCNTTASNTTISNLVDGQGNGIFTGISTSDITANPRYLQIQGAGTTSTLATTSRENATLIIAGNNAFDPAMVFKVGMTGSLVSIYDSVFNMIRIANAGENGQDYLGVVTQVTSENSGTNNGAYIYPPLPTTASSGTSIEIDHITKISSITNASTCVVETAPVRTASGTQVILSSAVLSNSTTTGVATRNYENSGAVVYPGTRYQPSHDIPGTEASASYMIAPNASLKWHASNDPTSGQSTYYVNSSAFSFAQNTKEEVDKVVLAVEFPGGLSHTNEEGGNRVAFAEFQVVLEYKIDPNASSFTSVLIAGRDYGGPDFDSSPPAWTKVYKTQKKNLYSSGSPRYSSDGVIQKTAQKVKFIKEWEVDLRPYQPLNDWRIGIKRMSPDASKDYIADAHTFVGMSTLKTAEAIVEERLKFPLSAYAVVGFSAEDFGSPPQRAYHVRGKKIKVPSNYFTREETGSNQAKYTRNKTTGADTNSYVTWDGAFRGDLESSTPLPNLRKVYCNNPAWIFYDMLTDKDIGLGEFILESDIDKYALYQIARHCDELVPDGKGGLEPRFTCNVYFRKQEEAYKVLKDLASTFRGMMFWIDGKITPIQDTLKESVYTFTNGNVEDGLFNYSYTGQRARVNQINVAWTNPDEEYKQTIFTIEDTANILDQKRIISKDVVAFGCTSEGQARRVGMWHLLTDTKETEIISFTTGINASFLRPGDFINVQDHYVDNIIASGRVHDVQEISPGTIYLDREITLTDYEKNSSHILYLIYPDPGTYLAQDEDVTINGVVYSRGELITSDASGGAISTAEAAANLVDDSGNVVAVQFSKNTRIEKRKIDNTSLSSTIDIGTSPGVIPNSAFTSYPNTDVIWAIGPAEEYSTPDIKIFRIAGLSEEGSTEKYTVTATQVHVDKYGGVDSFRKVEVPDYSTQSISTRLVPYPENISMELIPASSSSIDSAESSVEAVISWSNPQESFVDSAGNSTERDYRFTSRFEIHHNLTDGQLENGFSEIVTPGGITNVKVPNVTAGKYTVKLRTVSDTGAKSKGNIVNRVLTAPTPNVSRVSNISRGGILTTGLDFNYTSGKLVFEEEDYSYIPPSNIILGISSATTAQKEVNFNTMSNNTTAYLYYDASTGPSNPWKTVQVHTDTVARDISNQETNINYFKEVGASNNGLTATSGTVSLAAGSTLVSGSGTSFTSDFEESSLIKITDGSTVGTEVATADYFVVAEVIDDTTLYLKSSSTRTYSSKYAMKQSLSPDFGEDAVLGQVQKGASGSYSIELFLNTKGKRGAGRWQVPVTTLPTTSAQAQTAWDTNWTNRPGVAVVGDQGIFFEGTEANQTGQSAWTYDGGAWQQQAEVIDGDLVVTGSITTDKIFANAITAEKIAANQITANEITTNSIQAIHVGADVIEACHIVAGSIESVHIDTDAITADKIAAGAVTADSVAANSIVATLIGATTVNAADITTANLSALSANLGNITAGTMKNSGANSIPDANSAPSGNEKGAHIDLNAGKFVFGSASKHVLWDGTNLTLSGVNIDASSTVQAPSGIPTIKENGSTEGTNITSLDFTTGLNVVVSSGEAVISVDATTSNISEGTRLYFTNARADARVNAVLPDTDSLSEGSSNLYYTTARFNTDFSGRTTTNLTEGTNLYFTNGRFDTRFGLKTTTDLSEGTNLYHTTARVRAALSADDNGGLGSFSYNSSTGAYTYTGPSNADIRGLVSHSDAGGMGSFSYASSTGVFTYTGPAEADIRALFSGGAGIAKNSSGEFSISSGDGISIGTDSVAVDSTVVRTSGTQTIGGNKTFSNNVTVTGDFTVNGTSTTINTGTLTVEDNKILVNSAQTGTPASSVTAGIEVARGTSGNKSFVYAESGVGESGNQAAGWTFGSERVQAGTFFGTFVGDVTGTPSSLVGLTTDNLSEGTSNLYFTNTRAQAAITAGNGLGKSGGTLSVNAGTGIAIVNDNVTVSGLTTSHFAGATLQTGSEGFSDSDSIIMTAAAVQDKILSYGYTTNTGDITAVTVGAGSGLTGGGTGSSGAVSLTLNVGAGSGISVASDSVAVDSTVLRTTTSFGGDVSGTYGSIQVHDADTVDSLHAASFLRSDANDTFTGQLTMNTQKALIANDYGMGVYGVYSPTRYQHVWSMGTSYNLPSNGLDESGAAGNLYGLAWSYNPNYSYSGSNPQAKSGLGHQLLLMSNGTTYTALGTGIWTDGTITTTSHGTSANWNTAYGWGNHASAGYQSARTALDYLDVASGNYGTVKVDDDRSVTWAGYAIRDDWVFMSNGSAAAGIYNDTDNAWALYFERNGSSYLYYNGSSRIQATSAGATITGVLSATGGSSTNWNTAYGWGNHASAGYISGNQTITLSGDVSGSGTTSISVTVANDSHTHDTRYYTETEVNTLLAGKQNTGNYLTGNQTITLSGDATGSGTTSIAVSLAANSVSASEIAANAVGASELNVSGNGTAGQALLSDGDGTFTWGSAGQTYTGSNGITLVGGTDFQLSNNATGDWFVNSLTADTIDACHITASTISARELTISANADSTANSMFFNNNGSIRIYDSNSTLRVKVGNLA